MAKWTKAVRKKWQPYVDQQIRRNMTQGKSQDDAIERALDLRDANIEKGKKPPKFGKKKKD